MENYINVNELARMVVWNPQTVYRKAAQGQIPGMIRLGHCLRFKYSVIQDWLDSSAVPRREASEDSAPEVRT